MCLFHFLHGDPDRFQEAGPVASGSAHLLPFLPQPADPQQIPERRCWNCKNSSSDCFTTERETSVTSTEGPCVCKMHSVYRNINFLKPNKYCLFYPQHMWIREICIHLDRIRCTFNVPVGKFVLVSIIHLVKKQKKQKKLDICIVALKCLSQLQNENTTAKSKTQQQITEQNLK